MLLYIHGFGSCGAGTKVDTLRATFGADQVISPDLPPSPKEAMALLEGLITKHDFKLLVGSSLGGFYAEWLNGQHAIPSVLINPSTKPYETLSKYIGSNTHWCTGERFEWTQGHIDELRPFTRDAPGTQEHYLVLVQTADEVLDYALAARRYAEKDVIVEQGGNHRFENLADYRETLMSFSRRFSEP